MSLDKLRALDEAAKLEPEGLTWMEIASAKAQLAALSKLLRPAFKALLGELPINGRGECSMCAWGSVPDGDGLHFDADNIWGGDRPCLQDESYDDARAVLAQLEEALSPLPFEVQGDVKIVWESEEALK